MQYYPASRRNEHVWHVQAYDCALADRAAEAKPITSLLESPQAREYPAATRLIQDTVLGLYKYSPEAKPPEETAPSCRLNRAILDQAQNEGRWQELRTRTRLDEAMATLGAASLGSMLLGLLTDEMKRQVQEAAQAEQEARQQQALAEILIEQAASNLGGPDIQERIKQAQQAAQSAMNRAQQAGQLAVQALQQDEAIQRRVRMAVRQATKDAESQQREMAGWGLGAGGNMYVPPEERLTLAMQIAASQKLREIARLAGRLKNVALAAQAERVPAGVGDIYGVELGSDIAHVVPLELVKMHHPVLRHDLLMRLAAGRLMQYRLRERDRAALGPIVCVWDESGSMAGVKEVWAKAVALALLAVAQKQRRAWAGVAFSAGGQVRSVVFERPERQVSPLQLTELASHFFNGGTDFELALTEARRIIGDRKFTRADVVFITDGIAAVSDQYLAELLRWKRTSGVRIFSVIVSGGSPESVRAWSDRVESVASFAADPRVRETVAWDIFGSV